MLCVCEHTSLHNKFFKGNARQTNKDIHFVINRVPIAFGYCSPPLVTTRIRSLTEGNVFTLSTTQEDFLGFEINFSCHYWLRT